MPVFNAIFKKTFFWDGGVHNIDLIALNPIKNPVEMDEDPAKVIEKLNAHPEYPSLFKKAFGTSQITSKEFLQAMSQFMAMLISADSKYDQFMKGSATFSLDETTGYALFKDKCASCHSGELFSDFSFRNNGLTADFTNDQGRYDVSLKEEDIGKFKVPSLRNIAKTGPYMHSGKFTKLSEVLDYYGSGVKNSNTLDPILTKNGQLGIPLNQDEKAQIIAFLMTLTDTDFLHNPDFSEQ